MTDRDAATSTIRTWAQQNMQRLRKAPGEQVAEELGNVLVAVNDGLGVEVSDEVNDDREVIVTAFSDPRLFPEVHRIVQCLVDLPGWRFVALYNRYGFMTAQAIARGYLPRAPFRVVFDALVEHAFDASAPVVAARRLGA